MGVEDAAFLCAHTGRDLALDVEDLAAGLDEGFFEAIDFLRELRLGDLSSGNRGVGPAEHKDFPTADSRGNGDAAKNEFTLFRRFRHEKSLHENARHEKPFLN
jgi:hypothetical protein